MSKKRVLISIFLIAIGLCLTFYSFIVNTLNDRHNSAVISEYDNLVKDTDESNLDKMFKQAQKYNESLITKNVVLTDPFKTNKAKKALNEYDKLLNSKDGLMGYVEIPCIDVKLPIYHGTDSEVLKKGAGHIEGTSLPIGGIGTHSVIAAHSGLSTAKMFSDLELMKTGDVFYINCYWKKLAYKVDEINVVKPNDTSKLSINSQKDYVTLLTCTPYGVNDHRLLVRGVRISIKDSKKNITDKRDSIWLSEYKKALKIGFAIMAIVLIVMIVKKRVKKVDR